MLMLFTLSSNVNREFYKEKLGKIGDSPQFYLRLCFCVTDNTILLEIEFLLSTVNLPPVSDFIDVYGGLIIPDRINYPVISLANTVSFLGREFLGALRPGVIRQGLDAFDDLFEAFPGGILEFFYGRFFNQDFIFCHSF